MSLLSQKHTVITVENIRFPRTRVVLHVVSAQRRIGRVEVGKEETHVHHIKVNEENKVESQKDRQLDVIKELGAIPC